jgi:hypothetical protein
LGDEIPQTSFFAEAPSSVQEIPSPHIGKKRKEQLQKQEKSKKQE